MQLHQERFAVRRDTISWEAVVCFPRLGWHVHSGPLPSRNTYENLCENVTDPVTEFCTPSLSVSRCLSAISSSLLRSCLDLQIVDEYQLITDWLPITCYHQKSQPLSHALCSLCMTHECFGILSPYCSNPSIQCLKWLSRVQHSSNKNSASKFQNNQLMLFSCLLHHPVSERPSHTRRQTSKLR